MNSDQAQVLHDTGRTDMPGLHLGKWWETCWVCVNQRGLSELARMVREEQVRGLNGDT